MSIFKELSILYLLVVFFIFKYNVFMKIEYKVKENEKNINEILKDTFHISSRLCGKLKKNHCLKIIRTNQTVKHSESNSTISKSNNNIIQNTSENRNPNVLHYGDVLIIDLDYEEDTSNIISVNKPLKTLYEDEFVLAVNKPAFMPVHPSMNHFTDSLSNIVRAYFDKNGIHKKTRPVNRLDRNTSGIVVFSKNEYVQEMLIQEMKSHKFVKKYIAFVYDNNLPDEGIIKKPIGRKAGSIMERTINKNELMSGYKMEDAITKYKVLKRVNGIAKVECNLLTGRTHQIRLHFDSIGCPLVGETLYNHSLAQFLDKNKISTEILSFPRQALHCSEISFDEPLTSKKIDITSSLPDDMMILEK